MKITDLKQDDKNLNKGTDRGAKAIRASLKKYGAGRSVLLDKNGTIIAGNKTVQNALAAGLEDVIVVQSDGTQLVAVQRTDLDISDKKCRELAIADNRTGELSLEWDGPGLLDMATDMDLQPFFTDHEMEKFKGKPDPTGSSAKEIDADGFSFDCKCPKCGFEFNHE